MLETDIPEHQGRGYRVLGPGRFLEPHSGLPNAIWGVRGSRRAKLNVLFSL